MRITARPIAFVPRLPMRVVALISKGYSEEQRRIQAPGRSSRRGAPWQRWTNSTRDQIKSSW